MLSNALCRWRASAAACRRPARCCAAMHRCGRSLVKGSRRCIVLLRRCVKRVFFASVWVWFLILIFGKQGSEDVVKLLIKSGAPLNARDKYRFLSLVLSNSDVLLMLADCDVPAHACGQEGNFAALVALLKARADSQRPMSMVVWLCITRRSMATWTALSSCSHFIPRRLISMTSGYRRRSFWRQLMVSCIRLVGPSLISRFASGNAEAVDLIADPAVEDTQDKRRLVRAALRCMFSRLVANLQLRYANRCVPSIGLLWAQRGGARIDWSRSEH